MSESQEAPLSVEAPNLGDAAAPTLGPDASGSAVVGRELAVPGYEILGELGRGGMGVVYKARQVGLNRIVALKMILAGSHASADTLERFRTEAEAVARLQHANIVQIYEIGEQQGLPYFSMEYVDGGSLAEKLAGTPLPPQLAAQLVETLARAIHYAHERGIIHRDLKPANILLAESVVRGPWSVAEDNSSGAGAESAPARSGSGVARPESAQGVIGILTRLSTPFVDSGRATQPKTPVLGTPSRDGPRTADYGLPKVTDFGLAKQLDSQKGQTRTGAIMGTPSYMAPEQAGGSVRREAAGNVPTVGPAVDVYALGAILYELLTGRPPFKASTPLDTVLQVVSEEAVPPSRLQPKLPRDLETICLKCLEKDPRRRYGSADALAEDLRRFLADEPILARPAGRWERTIKWAKRRPALAALLVLSSVAPLVLAAVSLAYQASLERTNEKLRTALIDVKTERDHATQAKTEAEREHARAQAHLDKALEAVNRLLTRVGEERWANVPEFAELRKQVLEEALDFYRGFLKQEGDEPAVRREMARAYVRMAELYFMLSKNVEAENACKEAIQLLEALSTAEGPRVEYQYNLSRSYSYLGHVYVTTSRFEQSAVAYGKALTLSERTVEQAPDHLEYISWLVRCYSTQAYSFTRSNPKQAESFLRRAEVQAKKLYQARPDSADYQCILAGVYTNLGTVLLAQQRVQEAGEKLRESSRLLLPADRPPPRTAAEYAGTLAMNQVQQGLFLLRTGRATEALPPLEAGVTSHEELLRATPKMLPHRFQLVQTYPILADLYTKAQRPEQAMKAWQRAIELSEGLARDYPTFAFLTLEADRMRIRCVILQARQGDVQAALASAKALQAKPSLAPGNRYDLACAYAVAAAQPGTDKDQAEELAQQALTLLDQLVENGYFRTKAQVEHARKDGDLEVLRPRPVFQKLLERAEQRLTDPAGIPPASPGPNR